MTTEYPNLVGTPTDYSKGENWMIRQDNGDAEVDVFYLYPTAVNPQCKDVIADIDNRMRFAALGNFERGPGCFNDFTNIFAPYYRQLSVPSIAAAKDAKGLYDKVGETEVRTDAYAALDYYFEHYNNGRPFILASHSQGSTTMLHVLHEYMKLHPEYYERMIAAYVLGMGWTTKFQEQNPHIKPAQGETDTGVVISWNTEGPGATMPNLPAMEDICYCINPLNWKLDDTYAGIEENKGSYDLKIHDVGPAVADAQLDPERKVVVTKTPSEHGYQMIPAKIKIFGDASYHFDDWNFFYENIKENARKRIAAYFDAQK